MGSLCRGADAGLLSRRRPTATRPFAPPAGDDPLPRDRTCPLASRRRLGPAHGRRRRVRADDVVRRQVSLARHRAAPRACEPSPPSCRLRPREAPGTAAPSPPHASHRRRRARLPAEKRTRIPPPLQRYPGATQPDQDDVQIISAKAPLVPDDAGGAPASAKPVALVQGSPATIDGLIGGGGDADVYSFTAAANQSVRIGLELTTRSPLFASGRTNLDSEISVYGPGPAGPLVANLTNDDGVLSGVLPPVVLPAAVRGLARRAPRARPAWRAKQHRRGPGRGRWYQAAGPPIQPSHTLHPCPHPHRHLNPHSNPHPCDK